MCRRGRRSPPSPTPSARRKSQVIAPVGGLVIGRTNLPLITEGEALYHIACFDGPETAADLVRQYRDALDPDEWDDPEDAILV
jgi:uncharacterized protein